MGKPRILVVDDHKMLREAAAEILLNNGFDVVGSSFDGEDAVSQARNTKPDLVLMDVVMPRMSGIEATRIISRELPDTKIVMFSAYEDDEKLFACLKAGAHGYVLKNALDADLSDWVLRACRGQLALSPEMVHKLLAEFRSEDPAPVKSDPNPAETVLTKRQREVLAQVAKGLSNREIASSFGLSENTVRNHVIQILRKLHVRNRVEAAAVAITGTKPKSRRRTR